MWTITKNNSINQWNELKKKKIDILIIVFFLYNQMIYIVAQITYYVKMAT